MDKQENKQELDVAVVLRWTQFDIEDYLISKLKGKEFCGYSFDYAIYDLIKNMIPQEFRAGLSYRKSAHSKNSVGLYYCGAMFLYIEAHKKMTKRGSYSWYGKGSSEFVFDSFEVSWMDGKTLQERLAETLAAAQQIKRAQDTTRENAVDLIVLAMQHFGVDIYAARNICEYANKHFYSISDTVEAKIKLATTAD